MKLSITGPPGSGHFQIGRMLAERLQLDHLSAKQLAEEYCADNNIPYYLFKLHEQSDVDQYVNTSLDAIRSRVNCGVDAVVDALSTKKWKEFIRLCVMQDSYIDKLKAPVLYTEEVREKWFMDDEKLFEISPGGYDIWIHRMYLNNSQVVNTIIDSIVDGVLEANYVHPYQVLPMFPRSMPSKPDDWFVKNKVFRAKKFGFLFLLDNPDDYDQYSFYLRKGLMMNLDLEEAEPTELRRRPNSDYDWLLKYMPKNCFDALMLSYMLAKYAAAYEVKDVAQLYTDLSKNANPVKRLREAGFDK